MIGTRKGPMRAIWAWLRRGSTAVGLAAGLVTSPAAQSAVPLKGPVPGWVVPLTPEESTPPSEQIADGMQYLLFDQQVRVDGADRVAYRHVAAKALNERGVESLANIELGFDPSYQTLTLHMINLRRGDRVIAKLQGAQVKVLQRETALESRIYDGSRTANVFLEDVRAGDVVEYAYSLRGHNPVFGGRHFSGFSLQYSVPVARLHARLLWPAGRPLHWQRLNAAPEPVVTPVSAHQAHTWDLRSVAARTVETDAPAWFDPYPAAQWSEFADWQAVRDWALPLYARRAPGRPVQAVIDELAAHHAEPAQRLTAALQYVQAEVRYLGIEVGPGSHAPNRPELVLARRYGDCKDKTLLLLTLLQGLGIEAAPALVHTQLRHSIATFQASPGAFNHVLVRARVDGQAYWLDPTRPPQRGQLAQITQVDFGRALVVAADTPGLSPMAGDEARMHRREVRAMLDASDGVGKPARYTVATTAHGAAAESLRAALGMNSREMLQKQYLNFYAGYFGAADVASPLVVVDDVQANRLTVTEHYLLKEFWKRSDGNARVDGQIEVPDLSEHLRRPPSLVRHAPLALSHPAQLDLVTEVKLPGAWKIALETADVEDAAFRFKRQTQWDAGLRRITFTDRFESKTDHVAPEELARYAGNLEKARTGSSYVVYQHDSALTGPGGGGTLHWLPAVVGMLALFGWAWVARRVYAWNPPPQLGFSAGALPPAPRAIGGWLLLAAIGLPVYAWGLVDELRAQWPWWSTQAWFNMSDPAGSLYHPVRAPVVLVELVAGVGLVALLVVTAILFFQRRSSLPRVYVTFLAAAVSFQWLDLVVREATLAEGLIVGADEWVAAVRSLVVAAVWIAYFMKSERVRQTFVWPHRPRRALLRVLASATA